MNMQKYLNLSMCFFFLAMVYFFAIFAIWQASTGEDMIAEWTLFDFPFYFLFIPFGIFLSIAAILLIKEPEEE